MRSIAVVRTGPARSAAVLRRTAVSPAVALRGHAPRAAASRRRRRPRRRPRLALASWFFSMKASSWPIRVLAGELTSASGSLGRAEHERQHLADQHLAAGQLGDVLDLLGADDDAVNRAALDRGLLERLDLGRELLGQLGDPSPPQATAEGPSRYFESPSIPRSAKTRRASEFFSTRSRIDFFRRSRRSWYSAWRPGPSGPGSAATGCRRDPTGADPSSIL